MNGQLASRKACMAPAKQGPSLPINDRTARNELQLFICSIVDGERVVWVKK